MGSDRHTGSCLLLGSEFLSGYGYQLIAWTVITAFFKRTSQMINSNEVLKAPVLFLVFNRPSCTEKVFKAIAAARPSKLYVAADGARSDRVGETDLCAQVRSIATNVDWECEVETRFQSKNLGCREAVSGAIDWFFEHEEEGYLGG